MTIPTTLDELQHLIRQYAPILYLNPNEQYQLANVEYFLDNANLIEIGGSNNPVKTHPLTASDLPAGEDNGKKYQLVLKDDSPQTRAGDPANAKIYVHVKQPDSTHLDLQFWFFYAYNGPGTIYLKCGYTVPKFGIPPYENKEDAGSALAEPLGEHEGDWEHITIRLALDSGEIDKVYFSQHSGGVWKTRSELKDWEDGRLVVYSSLNGHASYPQGDAPNFSEEHDWSLLKNGLTFALVNATGKGARFDVAEKFEVMAVDSSLSGIGFTSPAWVNFYGRWGKSQDTHLSEDAIERIGHLILGSVADIAFKIPGVSSGIFDIVQHFATMSEDGPTAPISKPDWSGSES